MKQPFNNLIQICLQTGKRRLTFSIKRRSGRYDKALYDIIAQHHIAAFRRECIMDQQLLVILVSHLTLISFAVASDEEDGDIHESYWMLCSSDYYTICRNPSASQVERTAFILIFMR